METWVAHFKRVLQAKESRPSIGYQEEEISAPPPLFMKEEVDQEIASLGDKKACGADGIYNEHLKSTAPFIAGTWTNLFNACLKQGYIPDCKYETAS